MKKLYIVAIIVVMQLQLGAQGIHKFWGLTVAGGKDDIGVIFNSKPNGTGLQVQYDFNYLSPGGGRWNTPLVEYNGKLYGTTSTGGLYTEGTIFEYDMATGVYKKCADIYPIGGKSSVTSLTLWNNKFYGTTYSGGTDDRGILFEFDPVSKTVAKKFDFGSGTGLNPTAPLCLYNNKLYGATQFGGADNRGTVFQYDPASGILEHKVHFDVDNTGWDMRSSFRIYNNKFYGTCFRGGTKDSGTIVEFDPQTNALVKKADFTQIGTSYVIDGGLTLFNGKFYSCSTKGGNNDLGVLFEYNPSTGTLVKKIDLTVSGGNYIYDPMIVYGNRLYGTTLHGGNKNEGVIFEYDPLNNIYTKKVNFGGGKGSIPVSPLFQYNNKLYGTTREGGIRDNGVLYEYDPQINGIQVKGLFRNSYGHTPMGDLTYYKGQLFGTTEEGGENGHGVIFSYDLASGTYTVLHQMDSATGMFYFTGGLTLYNDKFYGVTIYGGVDDKGVLFEFDPATNSYTKKFDFGNGTARYPRGKLTSYNNKLYGTTTMGGISDGGVIYVYDPANNTYSEKVHLSHSIGTRPYGTLTLYNGKFFGTASEGGADGSGTLFEYDPSINGIINRHDFQSQTDGSTPQAALTVLNGKLYGTTTQGIVWNEGGTLFEYDPATYTLIKKHDFANSIGKFSATTLHGYRGKLYGMTTHQLGTELGKGAVFEYNPENGTVTEKTFFNQVNGRWPNYTELTTAPAPTAHGTPGTCEDAIQSEMPSAYNQWFAFTNAEGDAVAEVNPNGNDLGRIDIRYYVHNGATRTDNKGQFYLNRNITIDVQKQPVHPVQVRLYIRASELDALAKTPGSGVINPEDIAVFKNSDDCGGNIQSGTVKLNSAIEPWGFDYVITVTVESFSTFYFASNGITALPVELEYFKGSQLETSNKLEWKGTCTNDVDFDIERSSDGVNFETIGIVWAAQGSCDKPFTFIDDKAPVGNSFYRLQMKENNGEKHYSKTILLSREQTTALQAKIFPNPVISNHATLQINAIKRATLQTVISDITGRALISGKINVEKGLNNISLQVQQLPPGIYQLMYNDGDKNHTIRFVKQ